MRTRYAIIILVSLLAAVLSLAYYSYAETSQPISYPQFTLEQTALPTNAYGLNAGRSNSSWLNPSWINGLIQTGASWIRTDIYYGGPGEESYNFIRYLKQNGFKILGIFCQKIARWTGNGWEPIPDLTHWRQLVQRALTNYGSYLDAIEMWNEPDLTTFESGYMDGSPTHYLDMLRVLREEITLKNLQIPIVAGAVATMRNTETTPGDNYGGYFLKRIHDLGADNYCDAYSIHIYKWFLNGYNGLNSLTDAYVRAINIVSPKPVWVTEIGHEAIPEDDQALQAQTWLTEMKTLAVPFVAWFNYYEGDKAIMRDDFTARPAYYIFQKFALSTTILGDINSDGVVNIRDAAQLVLYWSKMVPPAPANVDVNGDGVINILDFAIIGVNWQRRA